MKSSILIQYSNPDTTSLWGYFFPCGYFLWIFFCGDIFCGFQQTRTAVGSQYSNPLPFLGRDPSITPKTPKTAPLHRQKTFSRPEKDLGL